MSRDNKHQHHTQTHTLWNCVNQNSSCRRLTTSYALASSSHNEHERVHRICVPKNLLPIANTPPPPPLPTQTSQKTTTKASQNFHMIINHTTLSVRFGARSSRSPEVHALVITCAHFYESAIGQIQNTTKNKLS